MMKRKTAYHWGFYIAGLLILALGLTLNTKAGLGVSPIISVSYSAAAIWGFNFGNATFVLYGVFIAVQLVLHTMHDRRLRGRGETPVHPLKRALLMDVLQFPLSLVFTRFMNLFSAYLPDCSEKVLAERIAVLLVAIALTGIGAAMSLDMRLVPNPGDGIVQAIADFIGKSVGFTKNCFDVCNITIAITINLVFAGHLVGVGLGTVIAVIGVGRVIALFNHLFKQKITALSGVAG